MLLIVTRTLNNKITLKYLQIVNITKNQVTKSQNPTTHGFLHKRLDFANPVTKYQIHLQN